MDDSSSLISFIASMSGEGNLRVEENLGEGFVRLRVSEAERRQAKHDIQHVEDIVIELLRNARDAGARNIYVATSKEESVRTIVVIDDGCGIPADMHERIFEARVTSKLETMSQDKWGIHGRGMALFSIRQGATSAEVVASEVDMGSSFRVVVDTGELNERADQSTWPRVEKQDDGSYAITSGPHNIVRSVCEFALEELHGCNVYLGSPSEIAATLYKQAIDSLDTAQLLFLDSEDSIPVVQRLGCATDAADFIRIAASIGIDLSERTAHRILAGSIKPQRTVRSRLLRERSSKPRAQQELDLSRDSRGLKIAPEDVESFSRAVERDFDDLASRYYLYLTSAPKVKVGRDTITVTFDVGKEEC